MLFHQIQLMVCAALARRFAARTPEDQGEAAVTRQEAPGQSG
jgi:solute carrier family 10 (sodium/bile acid cotransporter), member 7